jgi:hypothetical protein
MAQKIGFFGLLALGFLGLIVVYIQDGFSDLAKYAAPASLLLFAVALRAFTSSSIDVNPE